ncbi:MAG: VPLPA-CTERM sorting domain-containing protein [Thiohalocapsa sp.]
MKKTLIATTLTAGLMGLASSASALDVDFLTDVDGTNLGATKTYGPITAAGFKYTPNTTYTAADLWQRQVPNDNGIGVCSEVTNAADGQCGNGDQNELSAMENDEVIRLDAGGLDWTDLRVSSLDAGGTNDNETGVVYFSDDAHANLDALTGTVFDFTNFGIEGSIWSAIGGVKTERYVFFRTDPNNCGSGVIPNSSCNNDYLVKGASVVPIPAAAWLFGSAMLGLVGMGRRRAAKVAS